jgi:hypothetical protein
MKPLGIGSVLVFRIYKAALAPNVSLEASKSLRIFLSRFMNTRVRP